MMVSKKYAWLGAALVFCLLGRFAWLAHHDALVFESDLAALLPAADHAPLINAIDERVINDLHHRIAIIIQGRDHAHTDEATDSMVALLSNAIATDKIAGRLIGDAEIDSLQRRVQAMLAYKERLLGDASRRRMQDSDDAQLQWRVAQVLQFPPLNITDAVEDPLGTVGEFISERMVKSGATRFDGLYVRVEHAQPTNLVALNLTAGELGNAQASHSVAALLAAKNKVQEAFDVNFYMAGIPLHATAVKQQTIGEIRWMVATAVLLTLGFFWYVTRSLRALLISATAILLAVAGGLVISYESIGLPHLIGLTMATTAIGICIDFSFHFWIHVRAGMRGGAAIKTIFAGLNMSFLTTSIGLLVITFTAIEVLARSAVFICGVLLLSWFITWLIVPRLSGNPSAPAPRKMRCIALPQKWALGLAALIMIASLAGLALKYHVDDNPIRLGQQAHHLLADDAIVRDLLKVDARQAIYLMRAESADILLESEHAMLASLRAEQLSEVEALSRLIPSESQQRDNQALFKAAQHGLDATALQHYLHAIQAPNLNWQSSADKNYRLDWVVQQPWASIERGRLLKCEPPQCASMIRARGDAVQALDAACQLSPECSVVSLTARQLSIFQQLRVDLMWALLLATGAVFVALYVRYGKRAIRLIAVPALASVSGIAAVAWAGMPVTVFSLAAIFPLLGLSIDYVVFASESGSHSTPTFLAIFASALTTSLSFGILVFSATPAVQFFALPVAVGIPVAWILLHAMRDAHV